MRGGYFLVDDATFLDDVLNKQRTSCAQMVSLYGARIEDLRPGDFVKGEVNCVPRVIMGAPGRAWLGWPQLELAK